MQNIAITECFVVQVGQSPVEGWDDMDICDTLAQAEEWRPNGQRGCPFHEECQHDSFRIIRRVSLDVPLDMNLAWHGETKAE